MKKHLSIVFAGLLMTATTSVWAAPADNVPPTQQQKNQVPDTNQNGNYLEPQADNNNAASDPQSQKQSGANKTNKPANVEKSKRFHEKPQDGGTGVKP
ncbi:hypothetical protein [Methylophilus medardicus]|nr:hypothetical protein [Methylophilus medardicus]